MVLHALVTPDDPVAVTRAETLVIVVGIAAALTTSILLAPALWWVAIVPALLIPLEGLISARWVAPALAGAVTTVPDPQIRPAPADR